MPRDRAPWQDPATARARARELAPKVHAARRRVIAHHEAGHLVVAAHLGVMVSQVSVEVARRFSLGAVLVDPAGTRPARRALAAILAAGGEAERRLTGAPPRGVGSDEAQLAQLHPRTVAAGRRDAETLVRGLWPYIEALAGVLVDPDNSLMSGEAAVYVAFWAVHGAEEARARTRRPGHPRFDVTGDAAPPSDLQNDIMQQRPRPRAGGPAAADGREADRPRDPGAGPAAER